jgi:hypothetical protein
VWPVGKQRDCENHRHYRATGLPQGRTKGRPDKLDKYQTRLVQFVPIDGGELLAQAWNHVVAEVTVYEVWSVVEQADADGGGWVLHWMAGSHENVEVFCGPGQPYSMRRPQGREHQQWEMVTLEVAHFGCTSPCHQRQPT